MGYVSFVFWLGSGHDIEFDWMDVINVISLDVIFKNNFVIVHFNNQNHSFKSNQIKIYRKTNQLSKKRKKERNPGFI